MQLTDINVVIAIISGLIGIYAGYKKALGDAQKNGESNARIIVMLEHLKEAQDKMDKKLDTSAHDRHELREALRGQEEQIKTLFNDVEEIKSNCKDCRKKCD